MNVISWNLAGSEPGRKLLSPLLPRLDLRQLQDADQQGWHSVPRMQWPGGRAISIAFRRTNIVRKIASSTDKESCAFRRLGKER